MPATSDIVAASAVIEVARISHWLLLLGLWLTYFSFGAVVASIAPLVPVIQADLGLSHSAMGSIMGAWQLVYIAAAIPCGKLLDLLGSRWALTLGVALIALSAISRAFVDDYWGLLLAVMVFGLGGPIISSGAPKVVTGIFTGQRRGLAMGIYMTGPTVGGIAALTLTHSVLLPGFAYNWRLVMLFWGVVATIAGCAWLLLASRYGHRVPGFYTPLESDPDTRQRSAGGIRQILRLPGVRLVLLMSVGVFMINHGLNNWLPELLRHGGMSTIEAGYWAALPMLVGILGSIIIPRLATPQRRFTILLVLCVVATLASLALTTNDPTLRGVGLVLQGIVRSSLMVVLILTLMELPGMGPRNTGTASGLFFSAAEIGGVLGPLGLGLMYDLTGGFNAGLYTLSAVAVALALGARRLQRSGGARPAEATRNCYR